MHLRNQHRKPVFSASFFEIEPSTINQRPIADGNFSTSPHFYTSLVGRFYAIFRFFLTGH